MRESSVHKNNIKCIVENALCTACGACCGICPSNAIQMQSNAGGYLVADVDPDRCNSCGLCSKVCPSISANQVVIEGCDPFRGACLKAYIGHSTDAEIRQKSQSGGVVTALLWYLLEQKLIEGAIVNRFNEHTKRPEVACVRTKGELLSATGSYYTQSAVVKTILDNRDKRTAAVVLGCQSEALALIKQACPEIDAPAYRIGLICRGQYSGRFTDDLIATAGADSREITHFRFRDKSAGGWPGNIKIYSSDQSYVLNQAVRHRLKPLYEAYRCWLCFDQMNIHSDVVAGDPWGIDRADNNKGNTVLITRTLKGQRLLEDAVKHGYIRVSPVTVEDVIKGQTADRWAKTRFFTSLAITKQEGRLLPVDENEFTHIEHLQPSKSQFRGIVERLEFSRKAGLERSSQHYRHMVDSKNRQLARKRRIDWPIRMGKRILRKVFRLIRSTERRVRND